MAGTTIAEIKLASSLSWGRFAEVGLAAVRVNQVKVMMTAHVLAQLGAMPRLDPTGIPGTEPIQSAWGQ